MWTGTRARPGIVSTGSVRRAAERRGDRRRLAWDATTPIRRLVAGEFVHHHDDGMNGRIEDFLARGQPDRSSIADALEALEREVLSLFQSDRAPEASIVEGWQLVISKHLIDAPGRAPGLKAQSRVPDVDGYEIYVGVRDHEPAMPTQLLAPPAHPRGREPVDLVVGPADRAHTWSLEGRSGRRVRVAARLGSGRVCDDVNRILAAVGSALL
jgi:hypothetical protein